MRTVRWHAVVVAVLTLALAAGCGRPSTEPEPPRTPPPVDLTSVPAALTWETYRGVRLPRSPVDGPKNVAAVTNGYSHTPQGAVLAAIRGQAYLILASDNEWGRVVATLTAPGPGRDEFAAHRAALSVTGPVPPGQGPSFTGFKVTHYRTDPPTAAVHISMQIGTPVRTFAYPVALQWIGDWRIVLPTAADAVDAIELHSLDGYTRLEDK
ncbi:hypothetical protein [Nocardia sp. XZ_19_369]|uniref:hypothetical protein n=1 Tax=Nocardia sp. XZ_19_369 TaxID=2769487 RepID=UPI00188E6D6B|nr:hypothetical protein [Nocardia sp. XZ_19_369]